MSKTSGRFGLATLMGADLEPFHASGPLESASYVHGDVERLAAFAELPGLQSALAVMDAWDGRARTARAWSPMDGPAYEIFPTREQLRPLYDAGCTIVMESIERFLPALRPLCRALERDLGIGPGKVNVEVFCARGRGKGRPHFDPSFTFNCQIRGEKTWRLARSDAIRFPTSGMFLGRTPDPNLARIVESPLPTGIEDGEEIIARPGTVVFVPPGVIHETETSSGSFAIAFAVEHPDTLARRVAEEVRARLESVPALRAARFGAQFQDVRQEVRAASGLLRALADEMKTWCWPEPDCRFRLRPGLSVTPIDATHVVLSATRASRHFSLDETAVSLLTWAAERASFTLRDATVGLPTLDPNESDECLQQLVYLGLMEREE